jgi:hypothetical protein
MFNLFFIYVLGNKFYSEVKQKVTMCHVSLFPVLSDYIVDSNAC